MFSIKILEVEGHLCHYQPVHVCINKYTMNSKDRKRFVIDFETISMDPIFSSEYLIRECLFFYEKHLELSKNILSMKSRNVCVV